MVLTAPPAASEGPQVSVQGSVAEDKVHNDQVMRFVTENKAAKRFLLVPLHTPVHNPRMDDGALHRPVGAASRVTGSPAGRSLRLQEEVVGREPELPE